MRDAMVAAAVALLLIPLGNRSHAGVISPTASPQAQTLVTCGPQRTSGQQGPGPQRLTDAEKASRLAQLQAAAASGDACSGFELGHAYATGELGPTDKARAFALLEKSAAQGVARAYGDLGVLLFNGAGVAQDYGLALRYLLKATDAGEMKAPRYVGMLYEDGKGTAVDQAKAAQYYAIAASRGDITGQCLLGSLYERGVGVPRDLDLAEHWYLESQRRGDEVAAPAMAALGNLYETRGDGKGSDAIALSWYRKAADAGVVDAKNDIERLTVTHRPPAPGRNECLLHFHT